MTVNRLSDPNYFDYIGGRLRGLEKRIDDLKKQMLTPGVPLYKSSDWPDNAVSGQLVRDDNDLDALWTYQQDDQWHRIGEALSWAYFEIRNFTPTVGGGSHPATPLDGYSTIGNVATYVPDKSGFTITQTGIYLIIYTGQMFSNTGNIDENRSVVLTKQNASGYAFFNDNANMHLGKNPSKGFSYGTGIQWNPSYSSLIGVNANQLSANGNGIWQLGCEVPAGPAPNTFLQCLVIRLTGPFPNVTDILIGSIP